MILLALRTRVGLGYLGDYHWLLGMRKGGVDRQSMTVIMRSMLIVVFQSIEMENQ
jgi:hypothetical protein